MSNEDICKLLGINQESVRTHKYRLKRKLTLSKEENLQNFLQAFLQ
jgi:DNA-binding CsgD family transcriptional regulator